MATNPNPSWEPEHCLFVAKTGGGKSQMLRHVLPQKRVRVIGWDRAYAHKGLYFSTKAGFAAAVENAIAKGWKDYRIFYTGDTGNLVADHEWWADKVFDWLNGDYQTHVVDEELAGTSGTVNRAKPKMAYLINEGRKYGLIHYGTTQRPQEIPKTITDNVAYLYVGQQKAANIKKYADLLDVPVNDIKALKPLQFLKYDEKTVQLVKARYKAPVVNTRNSTVLVC